MKKRCIVNVAPSGHVFTVFDIKIYILINMVCLCMTTVNFDPLKIYHKSLAQQKSVAVLVRLSNPDHRAWTFTGLPVYSLFLQFGQKGGFRFPS